MTFMVISYPLTEETPLYRNTPNLKIKSFTSISKGAITNSFLLKFHNHSGTHIDFPYHFNGMGKKNSDFPHILIYKRPLLIEVKKKADELIYPEDIKDYKNEMEHSDFLLIKTGFSSYRKLDPKRYREHNPSISPELSKLLKKDFSSLKGIGIDTISISSSKNREKGRISHKILLGYGRDDFILLEDINLKKVKADYKIKNLIILPWFNCKIDASPCCAIVEVED